MSTELTDGFLLAAGVLFTGWVAWTQSPTLSAPTTALITATLLSPGSKSGSKIERETIAKQFYSPFIAIGTTLTALLWLLSVRQPRPEMLPLNTIEELIVFIGWSIAIIVFLTSSLVVLTTRLQIIKQNGDLAANRTRDYVVGITSSILAYAMTFFGFRLLEDILAPIEYQPYIIILSIISAPAIGWVVVFTERRRENIDRTTNNANHLRTTEGPKIRIKYTVYKNRVRKYAAIHRDSCSRIKVHGGVSRTIPPTGEYAEGIETLEGAKHEAASTGWEVRSCSFCSP